MIGIVILGILVGLGCIVFADLYTSTDHSKYEFEADLSNDAKISNVSREIVGTRGHKRYRTTVQFTDGFTYESHDTDIDEGLFSYSISMSKEMENQIIENAKFAHDRAVEKVKRKEQRRWNKNQK